MIVRLRFGQPDDFSGRRQLCCRMVHDSCLPVMAVVVAVMRPLIKAPQVHYLGYAGRVGPRSGEPGRGVAPKRVAEVFRRNLNGSFST